MATLRLLRKTKGPFSFEVSGAELPIGFRALTAAYTRALDALERDLQDLADRLEGTPDAAFAWLYTREWYRHDNLDKFLEWYFVVELVEAYRAVASITSLEVDDLVPAFIRHRIEARYGIPVTVTARASRRRLREKLLPLRKATVLLVRIVRRRKPRLDRNRATLETAPSAPRVLLRMHDSDKRHRYGPLLDDLAARYGVIPFGLDMSPRPAPEDDDRYDPRAHITAGVVMNALRRAFALRRALRRLHAASSDRDALPTVLYAPTRLDLAIAIADDHGIDEMMDDVRPALVVQWAVFTRPQERMVMEAARRRGIPSIIIPARTLTRMKAAERLMDADLRQPTIADPSIFVIAANAQSEAVARAAHFAPSQIHVGSTHTAPAVAMTRATVNTDMPPLLLLLLKTDRTENQAVLRAIGAALPAGRPFQVLARAHPNVRLQESEKDLLRAIDPNWREVTGVPYQNFVEPGRTLAVTTFSTAALDCVAYGAGLLWLPYITPRSVTMADMIEAVGRAADSSADLPKHLQDLSEAVALQAYCDTCFRQAKPYQPGRDVVEAFRDIETRLGRDCAAQEVHAPTVAEKGIS